MQKIVPHLWFDKEALEAAGWYVSLFENSGINGVSNISDTPSGDAQMVDFQLGGFNISAISAGPYFKFNPSVSFMVSCNTAEEVDKLHAAFTPGGTELMPLGEYPFSKRYAWVQDKYGMNWQLMLEENVSAQKIRPVLLFTEEVCGKAREAVSFYKAVFKDSEIGLVESYLPGEAQDSRAEIKFAEINLLGTKIVVMDHGFGGDFAFNEALSLMVLCDNQEEIDYYWDKLSYVPEAEQCGWLKDQFGLSWQIVPGNLNEAMFEGTEDEIERVTKAFLQMGKFDLAAIEAAKAGRCL